MTEGTTDNTNVSCYECKSWVDGEVIRKRFKKDNHGKVSGTHLRCDYCDESVEETFYYVIQPAEKD